jgi:hypothetical protein
MVIALFASKKETLMKPKSNTALGIPTGLDQETWDKELFDKCSAEAYDIEGMATDQRVDRQKVSTTAHRIYKEKLEAKLKEEK